MMQRYPDGIKLRISSHELVILMRMGDKPITIRKDQSADRLRVHPKVITDDHFHHFFQSRMMRKSMESFQVEYFLVGFLEDRIGITVGSPFNGYTVQRRSAGTQPSSPDENLGNFSENYPDI